MLTENEEGEGISFDAHMPIADDTTRQEVLSKIRDCLANRSDGHTESSAIDRAFQRTFKKEPFNWKKALTKYIRGYIKANYTWNKPSRSGQALGLIHTVQMLFLSVETDSIQFVSCIGFSSIFCIIPPIISGANLFSFIFSTIFYILIYLICIDITH